MCVSVARVPSEGQGTVASAGTPGLGSALEVSREQAPSQCHLGKSLSPGHLGVLAVSTAHRGDEDTKPRHADPLQMARDILPLSCQTNPRIKRACSPGAERVIQNPSS